MRRELLLPLVLAVAVGVACALPSVLGYAKLGSTYEPFSDRFFSSIPTDETTAYAPAAAYFKENVAIPGDIDIYEHRNDPIVRYFLPSLIEGTLSRLVRGTGGGWLLVKLLFPALSFLLAYGIARKLVWNRNTALLAALLFCALGFGPRTLVGFTGGQALQPLLLSRVSAPADVLPFLLLGVLGLVMIQEGGRVKGALLAGAAGGLLFYGYYYYQIAFALTLVVMAIVLLAAGYFRGFRAILAAGLLANILAIPWYLNFWKASRYSGSFLGDWLPAKTLPSLGFVCVGILSILVVVASHHYIRRGDSPRQALLRSPEFPVLILVGVAVIAGTILPALTSIIQPGHFQQYVGDPFVVFTAGLAIGVWLSRRPRLYLYFPVAFIVLPGLLFAKQFAFGLNSIKYSEASSEERMAETMIRTMTTPDDVIATQNPYWNSALPARVWRYRFYAFFGLTAATGEENTERYLAVQKLFGRSWEEIVPELKADPATIASPLKTMTIPYLLSFSKEVSAADIDRDRSFYESLDATYYRTKRLDYLVALGDAQQADLERGTKAIGLDIQLVSRVGDVALYRLTGS